MPSARKITYQAGDLKRKQVQSGWRQLFVIPRSASGAWSGRRTKIDWLEVKWPQPSGATERFTDLPIDKYITITEGGSSKH